MTAQGGNNDPRYHLGRIKASHKGLFERNGCQGSDIYTLLLPQLRYFLFGAELPDAVITAFEEKGGIGTKLRLQ